MRFRTKERTNTTRNDQLKKKDPPPFTPSSNQRSVSSRLGWLTVLSTKRVAVELNFLLLARLPSPSPTSMLCVLEGEGENLKASATRLRVVRTSPQPRQRVDKPQTDAASRQPRQTERASWLPVIRLEGIGQGSRQQSDQLQRGETG